MPLGLFTNKFSPKKGAPRKTTSLSNLNLDSTQNNAELDGPIKLKLGSNEILFDGGEWISGTGISILPSYCDRLLLFWCKSINEIFNCTKILMAALAIT